MIHVVRLILSSILSLSVLVAQESQTVSLSPPPLSSESLGEHIVCIRPMREGKFNISLEALGSKTLVHCYGHGGSGWTTLFGSVERALSLFQRAYPDLDTPVRVVGSGCMGLTMAIELARRGYTVAGITTSELFDIPSWKAAGYFALVSVRTSPEEQESLNELGLTTFLAYKSIYEGKHPYLPPEAVRYMPVYCSEDTEAGVEHLAALGIIPPPEEVTLDFGHGVLHPGYLKYMTYFMNTSIIMQKLTEEVHALGIPIELRKLHSFEEVPESVVFNCAGLGAAELCLDASMIAVRGHLVALTPESAGPHMDYMIYTKVEQGGKEAYIYMFPKNLSISTAHPEGKACAAVLGGTFLPPRGEISPEEQAEEDALQFRLLLDRNSEFFLGHPFYDDPSRLD